jgi:hypothetical protein
MKISTFPSSEKQAQMLELLKYGTVMAFVDSRHKDVLVPDYLKNDFQLRLNFDYAFEIDDFRVLPDRLEASLSFNKQNFFCVIPFGAVYLLLNHSIQRGSLFAENVPVEMLEIFSGFQKYEQQQSKTPLKPVASPAPDDPPIPAEPSQVATVSPAPAPAEAPNVQDKTDKKRRSHLRVVK